MARKSAAWGAEKLILEKACVDVYENGVFKTMKQALSLAPQIDPTRFDIDEDDDQPEKDPSPTSST